MMTIDIAVAGFLLMLGGFILKIMGEMKSELKESLTVEGEILTQLELLSYRVLQLENKM
ncbi:hypothetical protein WJM97_22800 (plasmid) [Okeanomitos corallinicola TIOX110]|uniref:Uncharacterized protein n=1 Tax=Okeanomitos corallinicola TIOX110 TaxID=3133117 RepID=A0ABZ2UYN0_9CYAN